MCKQNNADMRLLECWLPLAQESNQLYGWNYDAPALEALILRAAPDLVNTHTLLEARVILWHHYLRTHPQYVGHSTSTEIGRHDVG
jgi:hypothetical protein